MRMIKSISFTDEYSEEFIKFCKESNSSLLVCELLRDYYKEEYAFKEVKRDLTHIKEILKDITQMLEVSKYE